VHIIRLPTVHRKNLATILHVLFSTFHVLFQRADIIHYHGVGPATLAWIPRLFKWRAKIVVTFHNRDGLDEKWSWFARAYLRFGEWAATHFPHEIIVVSHTLQVYCRKRFGTEAIYIPNGAALPRPQGTDHLQAFGLKPNGYMLSVSRLVERKGQDVAIEAYRHLETSMPLVIAGDAEFADRYVEKLERLAAKDGRVKLIGYQTGKTLAQLLAHCYAFVHPARAEGLPVVVIEAMANAKLVIMSDIKENLELIDHSGISFPVDSRSKLRETLAWVLKDPAMVKTRGERAKEVVRRFYSWDSIVERTELAYRSLR
jgi:glycosyltransferase involved in cell wall biosynthesis